MRPIHFPDFALHLCGPASTVLRRQVRLFTPSTTVFQDRTFAIARQASKQCTLRRYRARRLVRVGYGLLPRSPVPVVSTRTRTTPTESYGDSSRLYSYSVTRKPFISERACLMRSGLVCSPMKSSLPCGSHRDRTCLSHNRTQHSRNTIRASAR